MIKCVCFWKIIASTMQNVAEQKQLQQNGFSFRSFHSQNIKQILLQKMRRSSVSKSSMFKIQTEKSHFRDFIERVDTCKTTRMYPHLLENIKKGSEQIYDLCYDFGEESAFLKGLNYGCRNFGFSLPHSTILIYRDWFPRVKEVKLIMLDDSHSFTYQMTPMEEESNMWETEIDLEENQVTEKTKIFVQIVTENGQVQKMPPPASKLQSGQYGYVCMNPDIPCQKHAKKQQIIQAYTLDLMQVPLQQALRFMEEHADTLKKFNTLIIRNLFKSEYLLNRHILSCLEAENLRDIVSFCKNELGLKIILEWNLQAGKRMYEQNVYEETIFVQEEPGIWQYDLSKKEVLSIYLSNLSYYLTFFKLDGFHFKRIQSFAKTQEGQVLIKCMNLMNNRINEHGFTLAYSKVEIPGLNQPILEGGLGFTFSYTSTQNFMESQNSLQLKDCFDKILASSNCVPIDLDLLKPDNKLNLLFAVFINCKGIFCKGSLKNDRQLVEKVLRTRNQSQIFQSQIEFKSVSDNFALIKRHRAWILFNFSEKQIFIDLNNAKDMEIISVFSSKDPQLSSSGVRMNSKSCCILEE